MPSVSSVEHWCGQAIRNSGEMLFFIYFFFFETVGFEILLVIFFLYCEVREKSIFPHKFAFVIFVLTYVVVKNWLCPYCSCLSAYISCVLVFVLIGFVVVMRSWLA